MVEDLQPVRQRVFGQRSLTACRAAAHHARRREERSAQGCDEADAGPQPRSISGTRNVQVVSKNARECGRVQGVEDHPSGAHPSTRERQNYLMMKN